VECVVDTGQALSKERTHGKSKESKEGDSHSSEAATGGIHRRGRPSLGRTLPVLARGVEICAVSELNEERLQKVGKQYRIKGLYTDYIRMIETEKPDIVYAIMPTHHLYDIAATVMEMGCNLVVEKPLSLTAEQARMMAVLARKNKVITAVTLQRRFAPVIRTGKEMCEEVGPIHTAEAQFVKCMLERGPASRGAIDLLTGDGVHAVDTLR